MGVVGLLIKAQGEAECFIIQENHTPSAINHIKHSCIECLVLADCWLFQEHSVSCNLTG